MEKSLLSFPVFYNGLIAKRTLKKQPHAINLLLNGTDDVSSGYFSINEYDASKFARGNATIPASYCDKYLSLPFEERITRIKRLRLSDPEIVASAFHAFLIKEIRIGQDELTELERIIQETGDAIIYIEKVLWFSLQNVMDENIYISESDKKRLQTLHKQKSIINLLQTN